MNETDVPRQFMLLKLRDLLIDKEVVVAHMNMETARYDGWECDWAGELLQIDQRIDALKAAIEAVQYERTGKR